MAAAMRSAALRRHGPLVAVLEKRGRFLVAEPLFGRGPRTAVEARGAGPGDLVVVGSGKRGARVIRKLGSPRVARDVIVVGAGFAGLYLLHKLRGLGFSALALEASD